MGVRIIHFGVDDCHRVPVLQCAGYFIADCQSIAQLRAALQSSEESGAVVMTRIEDLAPRRAISITRATSTAPMVLFPGHAPSTVESEFDLVVPALTPPEQWLSDLAELIQRCHVLRGRYRGLRVASSELRQERMRSRMEYARNSELLGDAGNNVDADEQAD